MKKIFLPAEQAWISYIRKQDNLGSGVCIARDDAKGVMVILKKVDEVHAGITVFKDGYCEYYEEYTNEQDMRDDLIFLYDGYLNDSDEEDDEDDEEEGGFNDIGFKDENEYEPAEDKLEYGMFSIMADLLDAVSPGFCDLDYPEQEQIAIDAYQVIEELVLDHGLPVVIGDL